MERVLQDVPAYVFFILPFLIVFSIAFFAVKTFWGTSYDPRLILVLLAVLVTLSRMVQFWQFGIQIYDLVLFIVTFKYGIRMGLLFVFISLLGVLYAVFFIRKHMLIHTIEGPLLQTIDLSIYVIIVGIFSLVARNAVVSNLVFWGVVLSSVQLVMNATLTRRLIGIDLGRLSTAAVVGVLINYNLFFIFGEKLLAVLP